MVNAPDSTDRARVVIVGGGFSGVGVAIGLKRAGIDDFVILERAAEGGGTWRDNSYPGCACDVESDLYSFSFAPNPDWRRTFAPQPEIWGYLRRCIRRFGLAPHVRWGQALTGAAWDEAARGWTIDTADARYRADFLILAVGPLSEPTLPDIPGLDRFAGKVFHSARWDHDHDLTGARVAVIGSGASAVQFVPRIAPQVAQLTLLMRTPPWVLPRNDRAVSARRRALYRLLPPLQRLSRARIYWRRELLALGFLRRTEALHAAEPLARQFLARQIADPALRAKLTPDYRLGCKRILLADDFYPALARPNVAVVTAPLRELRAGSLVTADEIERPIDTLICATGFQVTPSPIAAVVRGRDGRTLAEHWRDGQEAHHGTTVAGFPNLFLLLGPNTGLGHSSMIVMIEAQVAYIVACLRTLARRGAAGFEVRRAAQARSNAGIARRMAGTIWLSGCRSWYLDARGRNTTLWPGFTWEYRLRTRRFDAANYDLRR